MTKQSGDSSSKPVGVQLSVSQCFFFSPLTSRHGLVMKKMSPPSPTRDVRVCSRRLESVERARVQNRHALSAGFSHQKYGVLIWAAFFCGLYYYKTQYQPMMAAANKGNAVKSSSTEVNAELVSSAYATLTDSRCLGGGTNDAKVPDNRPDRLVYFQHIHKAGGTSICQTAIANGETVPPVGKNCNLPKTDSKLSFSTASLNEQCELLAKSSFATFVATEGKAPDILLPGLTSFVMLRDPINRLLSHYLHANKCEQRKSPGKCISEDCVKCLGGFLQWVKERKNVQNFMVRFLSGGAEDLERAKRRLSDFTFVLLLEDYERHGREALRTRFGWTEFKRAGTYHNSEASSELNVEVLAWMKSHNALDIELYAFAQQLYTMQQAELAGHHVAKGGPNI